MKPIYTVGMLLILIALGTYVFLFERQPVDPAAQGSAKPIVSLMSFKRAQLNKLELDQNSPSSSAVLEQKGGKWLYGGKPADPGRIETLMTQLENWQAAERLEPTFDKARASEFGLEPPDLILRLDLQGQSSQEFKIGAKTPTNTGYYVLRSGDPALYLVYVNVPEDLKRLLTQPPLATPAPKAAPGSSTGAPAGLPAASASPSP